MFRPGNSVENWQTMGCVDKRDASGPLVESWLGRQDGPGVGVMRSGTLLEHSCKLPVLIPEWDHGLAGPERWQSYFLNISYITKPQIFQAKI